MPFGPARRLFALAVLLAATCVAATAGHAVPPQAARNSSTPPPQAARDSSTPPQAARYTIDPVHTRVLFSLDHAGYSRALGTVSGSTGTITFAPGDWSLAHVDVSVPLRRLELGDTAWNRAALGMLDADAFPHARFVSTRIEPRSAWAARVCGDLTLHGTTRDACLDVAFNQLARYPLPPFHRVAGFSASGSVQRSDFGLDSWRSVVGDQVELRIEAEARHAGAAPATETPRP